MPLPILLTGSSGFTGTHLKRCLEGCYSLVRHEPKKETEIFWDPDAGKIDLQRLEGFGAVIHLAGESLVGLWTPAKKRRIRESRVKSTRFLVDSLLSLSEPPQTLLSASAIGIYGKGFLADVCQEWEAESTRAAERMRVVLLRSGVILSKEGGLLAKLLPWFSKGLGASLGKGDEPFCWISLDDWRRAILLALEDTSIAGPLDLVAPTLSTNREFAECLAHSCHRPLLFSVPAPILKFFLGEMAKELLLSQVMATPDKLLEKGFVFHHPTLPEFL